MDKNVTMTVTDDDRINGWQIGAWDTREFGVVLKTETGNVIDLPAVTWTESDFKTKTRSFPMLICRTANIPFCPPMQEILWATRQTT